MLIYNTSTDREHTVSHPLTERLSGKSNASLDAVKDCYILGESSGDQCRSFCLPFEFTMRQL